MPQGIDFQVQVLERGPLPPSVFGVVVRGSLSSLENTSPVSKGLTDWLTVAELEAIGQLSFPVCLFIFERIEAEDRGYYSWIDPSWAEQESLARQLQPLTTQALDEMALRVVRGGAIAS